MYGSRTVIPQALRKEISDHLHGARKGVFKMTYIAEDSIFCPGISNITTKASIDFRSSNEYPPTQPAMPAATYS